MKTFVTSIVLLTGIITFAQEKPVNEKKIDEITITKKIIQKKADRMIFDVANSPIAKGTNAFDLLKETPLLSTTDDKTLKILGKNDVQIFMNGRKTNMSADAVIEMLKSMPSENIQKIEVITVPSSEFAIEGNQGIVNIVLKKKPTDGFNGNFNVNNTQAFYNSQGVSTTLNYRKGKFGINGNIFFNNRNKRQDLDISNGNNNFSNASNGYLDDLGKTFGGYINADYQINEKQNLGFSYNRSNYKSDLESNLNNIFTNKNTNQNSYTKTQNFGKGKSSDHNVNLNYELKTDDNGSKVSVSTSYLHYKKDDLVNGTTLLQDPQQNILQKLVEFQQETPLIINNYGILIDATQKFKKDFSLNYGVSYNHTNTDSDSKFTNILPPTGIDDNQTNHFIYKEHIPAVYATLEKNFGEQWATKIGVRYENTTSKGSVIGKNIEIERKNNNILPYLSVNYNPSAKHSFSYSFSSRVDRPDFWAITPVKIYLTKNNYVQNNPFAKPETYYNQELMYMLNSAYFFTFGHTLVKDAAEQIPLQGVDQNGERVLAYIRNNYGNKQEMVFSAGMQKQFFKGIWNANNSFFVGHNIYKGEVSGDPTDVNQLVTFNKNIIDYNTTFYGAQLNNTIRLSSKKDLFFGINYNYTSSLMIELGELRAFHSLDLSLRKMLNDWTFNLKANDIFRTSENRIVGYQNNGDYNIVEQNQYKRRVSLSITYNFGNKKIQKIRTIGGANDDIKNRTGN